MESDPHAVQVFKDLPGGQILAVSGKLLYVFQCQPVTVKITETSTCHLDLPVMLKNETWFVHHKSRVLIKESPTTECSQCTCRLSCWLCLDCSWTSVYPASSASSFASQGIGNFALCSYQEPRERRIIQIG